MIRGAPAACLVVLLACDATDTRPTLDPATLERLAQARIEARNDPKVRIELGEMELEAGLWFDAAETFRAAQEAGVQDPRVHAGLARAYVKLGYVGSTVRALRACFQKAPRQPDCLYAFAVLIQRDPSEPAQKEAQRTWARFLLVAPPDHPKRTYAESALAQLTGRFGPLSEAELLGRRDRGPSSAETSASSSNEDQAPREGTVTTSTKTTAGLNPFGRALQRAYQALAQKDPASAAAAFEDALALRPDDPGTLAGLAEALLASDQTDKAVAAAQKAWALKPEEPQVRFAFGLVMLRTRQRGEEALGAWRALLKDTPEYAERLGVEKLLRETEKGREP